MKGLEIQKKAKEIGILLVSSLLWAILWFVPLFQVTMKNGHSLFASIYEIFFHQAKSEILVGKGVDLFGSFWMVEQVRIMLLEGGSSKLSGMYAPFGFDLGENTGFAWVDAALGVPLASWLGVPGFYNLHVLFVCTFSLMGLMILFRSIGLPHLVAIPMAYLCFTNPFMIDELNLGRPTQISIWPLALLMGIFIHQQQKGFVVSHGIWAGILMALGCLTYWFTGIAMGVCLMILYLYQLIRSDEKRKGILFGVLGILSALIIVLPITWRMTKPLLQGRAKHSFTKLLGTPSHQYEWFPLSLQTEYSISSWSDVSYTFKASCQLLPFFLVIVLCAILPYGRKYKLPWFFLWIFTLGMSLSSGIEFLGLHIPTGLAVLEWIFPPMLRCQFEGRNVVVANMIGFVIVGYTLKDIFWNSSTGENKEITSKKTWVRHSIPPLLLLYALFLLPTQKTLASTKYITNKTSNRIFKKNPGGIIEFPLMASNYTYIEQIHHKQPIFGGMGFDTVRPARHKRYTKAHPGIRSIQRVFQSGYFNRSLSKKERSFFVEDGFRWIVVYKKATKTPLEAWNHFLGVKGQYISEEALFLFDLKK